ncbi:MAG: hypothetical protein UY63_C0013G0031 [Parcubacteria group bacterium GW2011_GWA2_51_10]|nr:MAG: hypothetical protein UY63_C0013G0031 [Parcubacteria group bacterium GW2011_GWA2_51_10]
MFRLRPHKLVRPIIVADLGSNSAGVCLIEPGRPAAIISAERLTLPWKERTPKERTAGVLSLLDEACAHASALLARMKAERHMLAPKEAYAIIHAHWTNSQTSETAVLYEKEETVTEEMMSSLARKALEQTKEIDRSGIFEASVTCIDLNGYTTGRPNGKRARQVSIPTLMSSFEPGLAQGARETLLRHFPGEVSFRSMTRAILAAVKESGGQIRNSIIIDIGGETANCIVMRDGIIDSHVVAGKGAREILMHIAGKGSAEEILSLMRMREKDACSEPECARLDSSLAEVELELTKSFGETMARLANLRRLPNAMTIIALPELLPWLVRFFSRIDFGQFTVTTQPFKPSALSPDDLASFAVAASGVRVDTSLALAASFVNIERLQD